MNKKTWILIILIVSSFKIEAQNNRINTYNNIGWYNYFGTFKLTSKIGLHSEYQWRRTDFINKWQQSLLRFGLNIHAKPNILFRVGYAWIETFDYGSMPIQASGKDFTEHRFYEMIQLTHKEMSIDFSHRIMLEQRLVGKYSNSNLTKEDEFPLLNRVRYMFRTQMPLKGANIKPRIPYIALYDEIFIGFGKQVNANVFDQNRIGLLLGYQFNKTLKIETGYLNQTLQLGRQINNKSIFQNNNGIILNIIFNLDISKKKTEKS